MASTSPCWTANWPMEDGHLVGRVSPGPLPSSRAPGSSTAAAFAPNLLPRALWAEAAPARNRQNAARPCGPCPANLIVIGVPKLPFFVPSDFVAAPTSAWPCCYSASHLQANSETLGRLTGPRFPAAASAASAFAKTSDVLRPKRLDSLRCFAWIGRFGCFRPPNAGPPLSELRLGLCPQRPDRGGVKFHEQFSRFPGLILFPHMDRFYHPPSDPRR